ncbi:unnamed protein product [Discula destructiva]
MPELQSILIIGAGELGEAILSALSTHSQRSAETRIDILVREESITSPSPTKAAANARLCSLGATLVAGNYVDDTVSSLAATFHKYDVVIQAGGYGMPKGTQVKSATAALQAGVRRYFPWQFGVDYEAIGEGSAQDLFDEMLQVRHMLRAQQETHWTVISTGLFMGYLFLAEFGVVDLETRVVRALGDWQNKVTVTTPEDIGRVTADIVVRPEGTVDRVVYIGGETISYGQVADTLDETMGFEFDRWRWDLDFLRDRQKRHPDNLWYKYQRIFGDGTGIWWDQETTLKSQRGIEMTTVRDYITATICK